MFGNHTLTIVAFVAVGVFYVIATVKQTNRILRGIPELRPGIP